MHQQQCAHRSREPSRRRAGRRRSCRLLQTRFAGLCSQPRAHVPGLSTGGAPLLGAGYVGGPPGPYNSGNIAAGLPYLGSNSPRLWFDYNATNTGNLNTTYANGPDFARHDQFGGSVTGVYDLSDDLTLKSITGYRQIKWNIGTDLDGTPETLQEVTDAQHQWQVSQEFQLLGKALDNRLNYVGGLYYFKEGGYVHDYVPFESLLYVYDVANDVDNKDYAAFFHADYNLTDHWGFTAGGRYTEGEGQLPRWPERPELLPARIRSIPDRDRRTVPAVLPAHPGQPELGHLHAHSGYAVPLQQRRDGVPELEQGLQGRRLDHAPVGCDHRSEDGGVQAGVLQDLGARV